MIRLIAVFIVAFGLGAYASLHLLTDYVESIKNSHKAAVRQGFEVYKYANTDDLAPLIKTSNLLARYSACELEGDEGDAIALTLSVNAISFGMLSKQASDLSQDTFRTGLMMYGKLKDNEKASAQLTEILTAYCEDSLRYLYDCEKLSNLLGEEWDTQWDELKPECT
ncbi:conserved hypothetical protein [Vibrio crassostreae]|uniref:hypothetical protein n=1 Tax=Vibrio crassostreae TaxID=246167 RepID=UPI000F468E6B|nr:hypothetical protein [Vibrio crassostreae]ROO64637.1 hypothetical protein EDB58_102531 [Vibrio crassostreae]CAK1697017.1 conserved hypothetical protein [Vibrio crassostreae]CAK2248800.1 conserved hypothetical protein [Vibrio crassostreae]CAK2573314.1 conserved hypothetical protein [Vibrio crassostreae]CAK3210049.1 conserved hypothetical protein [Vibrio crassostreae]